MVYNLLVTMLLTSMACELCSMVYNLLVTMFTRQCAMYVHLYICT